MIHIKNTILRTENLNLTIENGGKKVHILKDINLEIGKHEYLGIAGESGAGKSMLMYVFTSLITGDNIKIDGKVIFAEEDGTETNILSLNNKEKLRYCSKRTALILQDSINSLNPNEKILTQWHDTVKLHHPKKNDIEIKKQILENMEEFGIKNGEEVLNKFPHQLSGGMNQRISIAMALEGNADILICDEPTTSLDTINQRKVIDFLMDLCERKSLTMLYITHDPGILQAITTDCIIMKDGKIVEQGKTKEVFSSPENPYTERLLKETAALWKEEN